MNYPISTVSLSLLKTEPNPPASNEEELKKLEALVQEQKLKGHKYPLLAGVFLLFHTAGKNVLSKTELYELMAKRAAEDKNKIISSPTERYCIITPNNFKSKIKDIIKKKKWFTRTLDENGETIYTLNPAVVWQITPKIESYLKVIEKRDSIFQNKAREEEPYIEKQQEKKSPNPKNKVTKLKKISKKSPEIKEKKENNLNTTINNNTVNSVNTIKDINNDIRTDMKIENKNVNVNNILNNPLNNNSSNILNNPVTNKVIEKTNNPLSNNISNILNNNPINNAVINSFNNPLNNNISSTNNISAMNTLNSFNNMSSFSSSINTLDINNMNINLETRKKYIKNDNNNNNVNAYTNTLINPIFHDSNNIKENNIEIKKDENNNNKISKNNTSKKKKKPIKNKSKKQEKIIRASKSLSNVIEIKDNEDDFDIIIEDEREKNLNTNTNNNNLSNSENIINNNSNESDDINKEIEAILSGKIPKNYPLNVNYITNTQKNQNKKVNKSQKKKKEKKPKIEEINIENTSEEDITTHNEENNVIDLTYQRRNSFNYRAQNKNPTQNIIQNTKNTSNKNTSKNPNKRVISKSKKSKTKAKAKKKFLNNKRKAKKKISPSSYDDSQDSNFSSKFQKKKPIEEKFIDKDGNIDLIEDKKIPKKKEPKKNNILGGKMNSIISVGELLLNMVNNEELSQLMNKKIVYFKQKIEKKEKEIADDKKLIENLIHSGEKIKLIKNKNLSELINNLKSLYKTFKDKVEMLYGYKEAIEKLEKSDKNNLVEGIANYKQVYIESNQILIKLVNMVNVMVNEYGNFDEFISILTLEEKENWVKQNIGINNYDFRKKIKNARGIDDIAELFKQELDNVKIDLDLFKKYDSYSNKNKNNNEDVIIELNNINGVEDKNVIQIDDENIEINKITPEKKIEKKKMNDSTNKENINLTNENNLEDNNNKGNRPDKVDSLDTNYQSVESINNN